MDTIKVESEFTSGAYGKREVVLVRGAGATVWDENGRSFLDCVAGIGVANVGHCHPTVVAAICQQAGTLITAPEMVYNDQRALLLARLVALLPSDLNRVFLCNSGTEAVEGALKFARLSTGRSEIIATMRGFHGRSLGALSATFNKKYRQPFMPLLPGFSHVPYGNIEKMDAAISQDTAAVILEVVQGEGGVRVGNPEYLRTVRQLCDQRGVLLIVDEVQTGYGRTGMMFACEYAGIVPDLLCLGKAIAGGVPMGAIGIGDSVQGIKPGVHGSTFGGNALACAAALAVLDVYEAEQLAARAAEMGIYFRERLQGMNSPLVREVRGLGLMIGVELKVRAMGIVRGLMARGVLSLTAGPTVLRLLPPLVITKDEIDQVVAAITAVFAEVAEDV